MAIPLADHIRLDLCRTPAPRRRYSTRLWICPTCQRPWVTTRTPDPRYTADQGISWRWIPWVAPEAPWWAQVD